MKTFLTWALGLCIINISCSDSNTPEPEEQVEENDTQQGYRIKKFSYEFLNPEDDDKSESYVVDFTYSDDLISIVDEELTYDGEKEYSTLSFNYASNGTVTVTEMGDSYTRQVLLYYSGSIITGRYGSESKEEVVYDGDQIIRIKETDLWEVGSVSYYEYFYDENNRVDSIYNIDWEEEYQLYYYEDDKVATITRYKRYDGAMIFNYVDHDEFLYAGDDIVSISTYCDQILKNKFVFQYNDEGLVSVIDETFYSDKNYRWRYLFEYEEGSGNVIDYSYAVEEISSTFEWIECRKINMMNGLAPW